MGELLNRKRSTPSHATAQAETLRLIGTLRPLATLVPTVRDPRTRAPVFYERDRAYRLRESEVHTLSELGKFRVIATEDLATHAYRDHREEMEHDIRNLAQQGLVRQEAFEGPEASRREMLTLTKEGHRLLRANRFLPEGQSTYYGFVKPKEANHDADIYRLYQKEASRILDQGGKESPRRSRF